MIWKIVPCKIDVTKFQLNLPYLGYNTVFRTLKIRHYGPVCDVSETSLYGLSKSYMMLNYEYELHNLGNT